MGSIQTMKKLIVVSVMLTFSALSHSGTGNAWYWGKITKLITTGPDGSFEVTLENDGVKTYCLHDKVFFKVSEMGAERTKAALSMALTAFTADKDWGVVIDLPTVEQECLASATASQGAGIR